MNEYALSIETDDDGFTVEVCHEQGPGFTASGPNVYDCLLSAAAYMAIRCEGGETVELRGGHP